MTGRSQCRDAGCETSLFFIDSEKIVMGDKGSKDKGKKEQQKQAKSTLKEKRKEKHNKKKRGAS